MKKGILIGIASVALLALMVGSSNACVGPGLSPGFWKHNVGVYLGLEKGSYSDPGITGARAGYTGTCSKDTMGDWLKANWSPSELLALFNALSTRGGGAAGAAIRVGAANVFNYAADLFPYVD